MMRSLLLTITTISVLLCVQLRYVNVLAKKPSRPLPSVSNSRSKQPTKQALSRGSNGKQQRPLSRKPPTATGSVFDKDEDSADVEIDSFGGLPDDDDDEVEDVVITNQRKSQPGRATPRPGNGRSPNPNARCRPPPVSQFNNDDDDDEDESLVVDEDYDDENDDTFSAPRKQQQQQQKPQQRGRPSPAQQRPALVGRRPGTQQQPRNNNRSTSRNNNRPGTGQQRRPNSSGRNSGGRVVPYRKPPPPGYGAAAALAQGWSGLVSALPDPTIVKEAALSSYNAAKQTTSNLSANIYREVKGLTSSELEQVMLKATRPDDTAVKGKHVERLVGVTYQISSQYDIYDAVLRKLWSKMAEKDWRTSIKALYLLHRFSADGSPEHAPSLQMRLRELRRTRDPKRKDKFFNFKQLIAGDTTPDNVKFRAFMGRYAHFVLLRTQHFSGMFEEISSVPPVKSDGKKKTSVQAKPITATSLRSEHLKAAEMVFKAGIACQLKDGEICENTAIAAERVASDMMYLTSAVAMALNRVLKDIDAMPKGTDRALIKQWCIFYSQQLLPQTKVMVKKMSPNLDPFGLFLPSRIGTSVPSNLLEKGLNLVEKDAKVTEDSSSNDIVEPVEAAPTDEKEVADRSTTTPPKGNTSPVKGESLAPKVIEPALAENDEEEIDASGEEEENDEEEEAGDDDDEYEYEDADGEDEEYEDDDEDEEEDE